MTNNFASVRSIAPAFSQSAEYRAFHGSPQDFVRTEKPQHPTYILDPKVLARDAKHFVESFPGTSAYAVKCNPDETVLKILHENGVNHFDVASMDEIALCQRAAPNAKLFFMHPIKSPEAIHEAYFKHGIRAFVIDSEDELYKIMRETRLAEDLELFVRMALPKNESAAIDFSSKFGASEEEAAELLRAARSKSTKLGLCLHVGTQTSDPSAYDFAIARAAKVIEDAKVKVDVLDVGGGFPVEYIGENVPHLNNYMAVIKGALARENLTDMELMAEPGRVLVARSTKLIVRVDGRKGDMLFINDGTYGGLFDAGAQVGTRYPVQHHAANPENEKPQDFVPFRFAGPTCDSLDMMDGPFYLPANTKVGDFIEISNVGAYSFAMRTKFNGFGFADRVMLTP